MIMVLEDKDSFITNQVALFAVATGKLRPSYLEADLTDCANDDQQRIS